MVEIFKRLLPEFSTMEKTVLLTHADVDHCGLLPIFDKIIASTKTLNCLKNEFAGKNGYREENAIVIIAGIARRKNSFVGGNFWKISESIIILLK